MRSASDDSNNVWNRPDNEDGTDKVPASSTSDVNATSVNSHTCTQDKHKKFRAALVLAALGIVFGDIGTSPLYTMHAVFTMNEHAIAPTAQDVYGILSLVLWSIIIVVSTKYIFLVTRADNEGEGGILALTALLRKATRGKPLYAIVTFLGLIGASLFYGDSIITPAISVMSAVEGLELIYEGADVVIVPVSMVILVMLFAIQRYGTGFVGRAFGPIMMIWFFTLAALGLPQIIAHPEILRAILPHYAFNFAATYPHLAFIALGASVLAITGAEALYADMGHLGRKPIMHAWFMLVFPCLSINYLGQGALILNNPKSIESPFYYLVPDGLLWPVVILATVATIIASQAVISGAFSVTQQALNLGMIPRVRILHTSKVESGQIYIPAINTILMIGVALLIFGFKSSSALSNAYGLAVTGTEILTTTLFCLYARLVWKMSYVKLVPILGIVGTLELLYFSANVSKIPTGGWLPIVIASVLIFIMITWMWGTSTVRRLRAVIEIPLEEWLASNRDIDIPRVPGQSIYLHQNTNTVPLALKDNTRFNRSRHEQILLVKVNVLSVPHVRHVDRVEVSQLGEPEDGIMSIVINLGFNDSQDIPHNLKWSSGKHPNFVYSERDTRYYLSVMDFRASDNVPWYLRFARGVYMFLSRNSSSRIDAFRLPRSRTIIIGGTVYL